MDDIAEKLAELLNDPESLNQVRRMAEDLMGEQREPEPQKSDSDSFKNESGFNAEQIAKITSVLTRLKKTSNDNRSNLLTALKPHLSAPRREKVDTAIKLLKILDMLPLLKESGIFEF